MKWYFKLNRKIQTAIPIIFSIISFVSFTIGGTLFLYIGIISLVIAVPFVFLLGKAERQRKNEQSSARSKNGDLSYHPAPKPHLETFGYTLTGIDLKNGRVYRQSIARRIYWKDNEFSFPRPTIVSLVKNDDSYDVFANGQMIGSVVDYYSIYHISERWSRIFFTEIEVDHDKESRDSSYIPSLNISYYPQNIRDLIPGYEYRQRGQRFSGDKTAPFLNEYVAIDIETTGIDVFTNDIVEIAAVHVREGSVVDTFSELIFSDRLTVEATAINHITQEMIKKARKSWEVLNDFAAFVGDLPVLGHNIDFDLTFICAIHPIGNIFEDTCILSDEYLMGNFGPIRLKDRKLPTLCSAFKIESNNSHRALDDAKATSLCYERFKEYYNIVSAAIKEGVDSELTMDSFPW